MGQVAEAIVKCHVRMRMLSEKMLNGVTPAQFSRLAAPGGVVIQSNHAGWVYGHLAIYPARMLTLLGGDANAAAVPAAFTDLFKDGTPCLDDANGTIYPAMEEVTKGFFRGHEAFASHVMTLSNDVLLREHPDEARRVNFPTVAAHVNFMLNDHIALHLGQVSAWRRMLGLGSAV
jgi:hypothetical protein